MNLKTCPCCGVAGCEARFHRLLAHDFTDPQYGAVHHLVVAAYMLQHDMYEGQTLEPVLEFTARLLHSAPTEHDRTQIRAAFDGSGRAVKRERTPSPVPRAWTKTVLNVDDSSAAAVVETLRTQ